MTLNEMSDTFDLLYNNITSNQAPGLNEWEKSVFLTKAQDEIIKNYFNAGSNKLQQGYDGNQKRQIDFSTLTKVATTQKTMYVYTKVEGKTDVNGKDVYERSFSITPTSDVYTQAYGKLGEAMTDSEGNPLYIKSSVSMSLGEPLFDTRSNSKSVSLPSDVMMILNEKIEVTRGSNKLNLTVVPIAFGEYDLLMSKPYKRPLKYQAWRLINNDTFNQVDLVVGPTDIINNYIVRYVKRPRAIILGSIDDIGVTLDGQNTPQECELDPILHMEVVQRAVELAKIAWAGNQEEIAATQLNITSGQRSE